MKLDNIANIDNYFYSYLYNEEHNRQNLYFCRSVHLLVLSFGI